MVSRGAVLPEGCAKLLLGALITPACSGGRQFQNLTGISDAEALPMDQTNQLSQLRFKPAEGVADFGTVISCL